MVLQEQVNHMMRQRQQSLWSTDVLFTVPSMCSEAPSASDCTSTKIEGYAEDNGFRSLSYSITWLQAAPSSAWTDAWRGASSYLLVWNSERACQDTQASTTKVTIGQFTEQSLSMRKCPGRKDHVHQVHPGLVLMQCPTFSKRALVFAQA